MQFSCFSLALVCFLFSYLFEDHHKYIISVFVENQERTLFSAIAYDMKKNTLDWSFPDATVGGSHC